MTAGAASWTAQALQRLDRWFFAPAPAERLAVVRILVCGFALGWVGIRTSFWLDLSRLDDNRYRPVGVLSVLDQPLGPAAVAALVAVGATAGLAATAGWRWSASGPVFAGVFLVLTTHGASWGQILHTEHLPALHLLVLAATPAGDALSVDRHRAPPGRDPTWYGWPLRVLALVTTGTYLVAGVAKLRYGGLEWIDGEVLRNLVAHDNLRKRLLGDPWSPLARHVVGHPVVFAPAAVLTVVVELGAPLALLGGRLRTIWAAAAWTFHVGVLALMAVLFPYPLLGLAFAPLFPMERLLTVLPGRRRAPWPAPLAVHRDAPAG